MKYINSLITVFILFITTHANEITLRGSSKFQWPVPVCDPNIPKDGSVCTCCNPSCPVGCCCPKTQ